jgi:hypothetical protein
MLAFCTLPACGGGDAGSGGGDASTAEAVGGGGGGSCEDPAEGPPTDVFCIGLYQDRDPTRIAPEAVPYTPGLVFWSDGADKTRFLRLPPGQPIDTTAVDAWRFPVGTRAFKEFRVGGRLEETRLLWKRGEGKWEHASYAWTADGTTATLITSHGSTTLDDGYQIPGTPTCDKCHGGASDHLLGVEAIALGLPDAEGLTLEGLATRGLLTADPPSLHVTLPEDETGLAATALGYLHVNCGMACHSTRGLSGFTQLHTRLRAEEIWPSDGGAPASVETTDTYVTGVGAEVILGTYAQAFPGARLIEPGAHEQSVAWLAAHLRGEHQMPPIATRAVDEEGTAALAAWIDALPATPAE